MVSALTEETYRNFKHIINPNNLPRGRAGVQGAYHLDHFVPTRYCFDNNIPPEVCADASNLQMLGWRENVGSRHNIKGVIPPLFFKYISANSKIEYFADVLQGIFPTGQKFIRVGEVVVTFFDPLSNRALVVLSIQDKRSNRRNALVTSRALADAGVKYTILFEDEFNNINLLSAKLKHYTQLGTPNRIHARQCTIRECPPAEKKQLLDSNHIQGNDTCSISLGAYFETTLVAVMTFSAPRVALGQKNKSLSDKQGVWELSRFCTDVKYRIPGIASKLLTHFKRTQPDWRRIYSFADKRWSVGNMYTILGFKLTVDNPPSYFYVVDGVRKHRWNYRKDNLKKILPQFDPKLTEYANMELHGFWRVWDCGTLKFEVNRADLSCDSPV
jgi:hypothetical protein